MPNEVKLNLRALKGNFRTFQTLACKFITDYIYNYLQTERQATSRKDEFLN